MSQYNIFWTFYQNFKTFNCYCV